MITELSIESLFINKRLIDAEKPIDGVDRLKITVKETVEVLYQLFPFSL